MNYGSERQAHAAGNLGKTDIDNAAVQMGRGLAVVKHVGER